MNRVFQLILGASILFLVGCVAYPYNTSIYPYTFLLYHTGNSMVPFLPNPCYLQVTRKEYDKLNHGDVATYINPFNHEVSTQLTTHRLIEKQGDSWQMKGDNNASRDRGLMTRHNYVGVARIVKGADNLIPSTRGA